MECPISVFYRHRLIYSGFIFNIPHDFDKYEQANRKSNYTEGLIFRPNDIRSCAVRYYIDPLRRLCALHMSACEILTGNTFDSPFPRNDAQNPVR